MAKKKAIVKLNGGLLAMLCSHCSVILRVGKDFSQEELDFVTGKKKFYPAQFCEACKKKLKK